MPRLLHGTVVTLPAIQEAQAGLARQNADVDLGFAAAQSVDLQAFDFMFLDLQGDPANLLLQSADTPEHLKKLGRSMEDPGSGADPGDSPIPAAYTYFGQFVDHDITLEVQPADLPTGPSGSVGALLDPAMTPLSLSEIRNALRNTRTATLDLDSLYGPPPPPATRPTARRCASARFRTSATCPRRAAARPARATTTTSRASRAARTPSMTVRR